MIVVHRRLLACCFVPVVSLLCGCGSAQDAAAAREAQNELRAVGLAFLSYLDANSGKAPSKLDDLKPYLNEAPDAAKKLESGEFVLIYGADLKSMTAGPGNTIVGYEKDAPTQGGVVLMGDASVKRMTAAEFQAATKAKGQ